MVGKRPDHRVCRGEDPAAAGPQHPGDLAHDRGAVRDERDRAKGGAGRVHARVGQRQPGRVGLHQGDRDTGGGRQRAGVPQLPGGEVQRHHLGAAGDQPAGALRATAADLQDGAAADLAEQPGIGLPQPLRAPQEVGVAEEGAVFGLVVVGGGVPVAAAGPPGAVVVDVAVAELRRVVVARRVLRRDPAGGFRLAGGRAGVFCSVHGIDPRSVRRAPGRRRCAPGRAVSRRGRAVAPRIPRGDGRPAAERGRASRASRAVSRASSAV